MRSRQLPRGLHGGLLAWGILFAAFIAFYAGTYSYRSISDTDQNSWSTRALALHGDVDLARYTDTFKFLRPKTLPGGMSYAQERDGHLYSITSVGLSLTVAPLYAVFARLEVSDAVLQAVASIPFVAVGALLLFRLFIKMFPRGVAVGGTIVYAFGTTMWPVAAMGYYMHGPASLYQAIGLTGLFTQSRASPILAGVGFGTAAWIRPQLGIPLVLVGVMYLLESRRNVLLYSAGVLPAAIAFLVQNRWIWGTWVTTGYSQAEVGWNGNVPEATVQLLFGWWRGIFLYSPVLIVGVIGVILAARNIDGVTERRMVTLGAATIALIFLYARRSDWTGGLNQFGYRYLLDVVPFLVVLTAYAVTKAPSLRALVVPLGGLSVLIMTVGAESNLFGWDGTLFPGFERSPLGQSWIAFVRDPSGAALRLFGIAGIATLLHLIGPRSALPASIPASARPGTSSTRARASSPKGIA